MKNMIHKFLTTAFACAFALLTGSTWAVDPTVMWDCDFGTTSKIGTDGNTYTFNVNGNTVENGRLKITGTMGGLIELPAAAYNSAYTVLIKYSNLEQKNVKTALMSMKTSNSSVLNMGLYAAANSLTLSSYWDDNTTDYSFGTAMTIPTGSGYAQFAFKSKSTFHGWVDSVLASTSIPGYNAGSLIFTADCQGIGIGGPMRVTNNSPKAWTGLVIESVAIFKGSYSAVSNTKGTVFACADAAYTATLTEEGPTAIDALAWKDAEGNNVDYATVSSAKIAIFGNGKVNVTTRPTGTVYLDSGVELIYTADSSASHTGYGTVTYSGLVPANSAHKNFAVCDGSWMGTVKVSNKDNGNGQIFTSQYVNKNSTFCLNGTSGYLNDIWNGGTFNGTLQLEDLDAIVAWRQRNGTSEGAQTINKLIGAGTFSAPDGATQTSCILDGTEYCGSIDLAVAACIRFYNGTGDKYVAGNRGYIIVDSGCTAFLASGKYWKSTTGVKVDGVVKGAGTFKVATTFGENGCIRPDAGKAFVFEKAVSGTVTIDCTDIVDAGLYRAPAFTMTEENATMPTVALVNGDGYESYVEGSTVWVIKTEAKEIYPRYQANFANRIMTWTTVGSGAVDLGGAATFAQFDLENFVNTGTKFQGNQDTTELPGQTASDLAWRGFASNYGSTAFSSPGLVLRFPKYVSGTTVSVGGSFAPFTLAGIIVEAGASNGSTIPNFTHTSGDRRTELGDTSGSVPTFFTFRDSCQINRMGAITIYGDITFDIATDKYFDCNTQRPAQANTLQPNAIFRMVGGGIFKVANALNATGMVTLDYSQQSLDRLAGATSFISGGLSVSASTTIVLPENAVAGTAYKLATSITGDAIGTLKVGNTVLPGSAVTIDGANGKISYTMPEQLATVTIGETTTPYYVLAEALKAVLTADADVKLSIIAADQTIISALALTHTTTIEVGEGLTTTISGVISGTGALVKSGAGSLKLTGANTYTGGTTVDAGGIIFGIKGNGRNGPIGPYDYTANEWSVKAVVRKDAWIDLNGIVDQCYVIELDEGAVLKNAGNSIGTNSRQTKKILLNGDATVEAVGNFGLHNGSTVATQLELGSHTLTKIGAGTFEFWNTTVSGTGALAISAGKVELRNGFAIAEDASLAITKSDSANLAILTDFTVNGLLDVTALKLPISASFATGSSGTVKVALENGKPTRAFKASALPTNLKFQDSMGASISAVYSDGYIWCGPSASGTYTFTGDDVAALDALPQGSVVTAAAIGYTAVTDAPDGYVAWVQDGVACLAKETNTINIKFTPASATEGTIAATDGQVGGFPVAGKFWNHTKVYIGTGASTSEILALKDGTGVDAIAKTSDGEVIGATLCYYYMPNMYDVNKRTTDPANEKFRDAQTTGNGKLTYSYFDDSDRTTPTWPFSVGKYPDENGAEYFLAETPTNGSDAKNLRWEIAITNIPYQVFDLYIYHASDQSGTIKLLPMAVKANNGDWQYFAGDPENPGMTKTADYGDVWQGEPYCDSLTMTEGVNYLRYRLSAAALQLQEGERISVIYISHPKKHDDARLGLAGIQIVAVDNDGYFTRSAGAATTDWTAVDSWRNSSGNPVAWANADGTDVAYATIDADSVKSINLDSEIRASSVKLVSTEDTTFTFTASEGGSLTAPINASEFHGTIIPCEGMTGEIFLGPNAQITANVPAGAVVSRAHVLSDTLSLTGSGTVKIIGEGTVYYDGEVPSATDSISFKAETWTGTVWLKNKAGLTGIDFNNYGNAHSTVKCTGISGWFTGAKVFAGTVELENGDSAYALNIHDGSSGDDNVVTFDHLKGTGKILGDGSSTAGFLVKEWVNYSGDVAIGSKAITFGTIKKAGNENQCRVYLNQGASYTLSGQTWSGNNGIRIDGTIGGTGTLASATTFGDGATIDASGTIAINVAPTFGETLKVRVMSAPTAESAVKILSGTFDEAYCDVAPSVYVGESKQEGEFIIHQKADGVYVELTEAAEPINVDNSTSLGDYIVKGNEAIRGVGGVQATSLQILARRSLTLDPVLTPIKLATKPVFGTNAKIALSAKYANSTKGVFTLLTWDGDSQVDSAILDSLFDTTSAKGTNPKVTQITYTVREDSTVGTTHTYTALKLDLDFGGEKQRLTIMPLGDSITEGSNNNGFGHSNYRQYLLAMLAAQGYDVKSTGFRKTWSQNAAGIWADEDFCWHNGQSGERLISGGSWRAGLQESVNALIEASEIPDVIIMKIGTNDSGTDGADVTLPTMSRAWLNVVNRIIAARPSTKIIACSIMDYTGVKGQTDENRWDKRWNARIQQLVAEGDFRENQVFFADLNAACPRYTGEIGSQTYTGNFLNEGDLHPNWVGHAKNAQCLATKIAEILPLSIAGNPQWTANVKTGAAANVNPRYLEGFTHYRTLHVPNAAMTKDGTIPYEEGGTEIKEGTRFSKVGYYMELKHKRTGHVRYVWADMDAWDASFEKLEFPLRYARQGTVTGLHVDSNDSGVEIIEPSDNTKTGWITFCKGGIANSGTAQGAPASIVKWDWANPINEGGNYGAMQIYRVAPSTGRPATTLMAFSRYSTAEMEIGIGDCALHSLPRAGGNNSENTINYMYTYQFEQLVPSAYDLASIEIWAKEVVEDIINNPPEGETPVITPDSGKTLDAANLQAEKSFKVNKNGPALKWQDALPTEESPQGIYITFDDATETFTTRAGQTDNGLSSFEDYVLNLKPKAEVGESPDKPYIKAAAQQTTAGGITFNFFHTATGTEISPRKGTGFTVKYAIEYADSLDFSTGKDETEPETSNSVTVNLPQPTEGNSKVRYFKPKFSF